MAWTSLIGILFAGFFMASSANALTVIKKDFVELTEEAELILVGSVEEIIGTRREGGATVSLITVGDLTIVKGEHDQTAYTMTMLGGTVGEDSLKVPGAPRFEIGRVYVLFVKGNQKVMFPFVGVTQGQFRVERHAQTGKRFVANAAGWPVLGVQGRTLLTDPAIKSLRAADTQGITPLTLDEFLGEIRGKLR